MNTMSNLKSKIDQRQPLRIVLVGKYQADGSSAMLRQLSDTLSEIGCKPFLEKETALHTGIKNIPVIGAEEFEKLADLAIVLGGDGTMLGIARQIAGQNVPLIGVNMGRLGYMTDIPLHDVQQVLPEILSGHFDVDLRHLLEAELIRDSHSIGHGLALNDVVVNRSGMSGMVELTVNVNNQFMYNQRCDGLIVATPTGSTAYAMSVGGPILHPSVAGMVLAPIAPHALSNRPIVLPDTATITIELAGGKDVTVNFDMQSMASLQIGDQVRIKRSDKTVTLLHPLGHSDYKTLRQKLHWNEYPSSF